MNNRPGTLWFRLISTVILLLLPGLAFANEPLPEPLTLEEALHLAGPAHPSLALSRARLAQLEADAQHISSQNALDIGATLQARAVDPPDSAPDQGSNDSRAILYARKRLYDFGYTSTLESAATTSITGGQLRDQAAHRHHRLTILQAYFDALLADLEFARDNEAMAVAYVEADRGRERHELGQLSESDLFTEEAEYQEFRMRRYRSQTRQRSTRAQLAQLLDRPDQLPSSLMEPDLSSNDDPLPDYEQLAGAMLSANPELLSLHTELEAARLQVRAQRASRRPVLSGEITAAANERNVGARNPLEAELRLEIPIFDGQRTDAEVARAQAEVYRLQAELRQQEYRLRQQVLDIWLDIQNLLAQREQVEVFTRSRMLNFDRAQAEYELELKTDFGHALVGQSESALLRAQTEYALALNRARLAILTGIDCSPWIDVSPASQTGTGHHETMPH